MEWHVNDALQSETDTGGDDQIRCQNVPDMVAKAIADSPRKAIATCADAGQHALTLATLRFGAPTESVVHLWAGQAALIALCLIVAVLTVATLRAITRGGNCRPE